MLCWIGWTGAQPGLLAFQVTAHLSEVSAQKGAQPLLFLHDQWGGLTLRERVSKVCSMLTYLWPFTPTHDARLNKNPWYKNLPGCPVIMVALTKSLGGDGFAWPQQIWNESITIAFRRPEAAFTVLNWEEQMCNSKSAARTFSNAFPGSNGCICKILSQFDNMWEHFESIHRTLNRKILSVTFRPLAHCQELKVRVLAQAKKSHSTVLWDRRRWTGSIQRGKKSRNSQIPHGKSRREGKRQVRRVQTAPSSSTFTALGQTSTQVAGRQQSWETLAEKNGGPHLEHLL